MLKFKDSTRHYTGPGRQLPSVTTVAVSCSQIAYLGLLNYMRLLKLCSIFQTQTSTFLSTKKKGGGTSSVCPASRAHWERRSRLGLPFQLGGVAPVISGPSKVSLQTLHFLLRWKPRWADNEESAFPVTEDALCSAWEQTLGPSPSPTSACLARPALFAATPHQSRKN